MIPFDQLDQQLNGDIYYDEAMRVLYATDASMYRVLPQAVAFPKDTKDLKVLIDFAHVYDTCLIPRAAGTSLAGQVVGEGIVVDISKYMTEILEINPEEQWVRVQPGVIRNDLNHYLKVFSQFFGPETATQSRAMIGGMVGNNSCGSNSIIYGSTRDHLLEIKGLLSDGSEVTFRKLTAEEFDQKRREPTLEGKLYQQIQDLLSPATVRQQIREEFPHPTIPRRNTGYAIDLLAQMYPFETSQSFFDMTQMIAGSEGTLMMMTEIKLATIPLPPKDKALICIHCNSIDEALQANIIAVQHQPSAAELIDHIVLDCTKTNKQQQANRFFVEGDPQAILAVELFGDDPDHLQQKVDALITHLRDQQLGYAFVVVDKEEIHKVWALRNAGLGLLSNVPGDAKPVCVVEDTAVDVLDLPAYIRDFGQMLQKHELSAVHYAHAGSGELHLRPLIDLKTQEGQRLFKVVATDTAHLVKRYKGSLSGEHGDGRLRGPFIEMMIGKDNYALLRKIKKAFDPEGIFNPHKIVDTPEIDTALRYEIGKTTTFDTMFDFSEEKGILRMAEKCNGAAACRKTVLTGGTMCPSYMATKDEKDTTRARANILREFLTRSPKTNRFDHKEIKEIMDLCLSCKGCKTECPSNVDMAKLKAEFLYQYYQSNPVPLRTKLIANISQSNKWASKLPSLYNFFCQNPISSKWLKKTLGFAPQRSLPTLHKKTLYQWWSRRKTIKKTKPKGKVFVFCDEFSNYLDVEVGKKMVQVLEHLGYEVVLTAPLDSGRAYLSKGLLSKAKALAIHNVKTLYPLIHEDTPLLGIEPSAILSFRDEYLGLVPENLQDQARQLSKHCLLLEEFLSQEHERGRLELDSWQGAPNYTVKIHGHCHQKALSDPQRTQEALQLFPNLSVESIPSGCCGMAGSFGYEKEHYAVSMQVGELVLFPTIRASNEDTYLVASGTSCRHQIKDGTDREAMHLAELLFLILKEE